jgi:hypothetical protein
MAVTSRCIASGRGCEAGNPTIGALDESERRTMTEAVLDQCRKLRVDVGKVRRCFYCGAVFIEAWDESTREMRKMQLGYRDDATDTTAWFERQALRWVDPRRARRRR